MQSVVQSRENELPPGCKEIPSGTVTFAFTDIQGSTARWERDPAAMQAALRVHDALLRETIEANGGYVFKTIGDAFCATFRAPADALAAMIACQRRIAETDFSAVSGLRIRAALHSGTSDEREGDYFGPSVNRVARLLGLAYGGQVLVSGVTTELARPHLTSEVELIDLGEHLLKDLARPERVFQVVAPGLAREFPALRSLRSLPNNLPHQLSSFVGREREVDEIAELVARHRLVTVTGSGGVGKTRTTLQVGANLLDSHRDGVWFIELAPLVNGDYLVPVVAQTLGITLGGEDRSLEVVVAGLAGKRALLILDNCEHLIDAAAKTIDAILRRCPHVSILASSRQRLGVPGEALYRMPPLAVPVRSDEPLRAEAALAFPAVALFVARARAGDDTFELDDRNAAIVGDICARLDGVPLAIELAAARVRLLGPSRLRERLSDRFRVLTRGDVTVLPRQQTLEALIDWSYELLDEREREFFRRLSAFVNGFSIEAAAAVAAPEGSDDLDALDVLGSLVDKSLVQSETKGDEARFRLLESTRAYARRKLEASGEAESIARRHLRYYCSTFAAKTVAERLQPKYVERLAVELEDVRAALDFALTDDPVAGAELFWSAGFWERLGLHLEAIERAERFMPHLTLAPAQLKARLWRDLSYRHLCCDPTRGLAAANQCVTYGRASGDPELLLAGLQDAAISNVALGRYADANAALDEMEALLPSVAARPVSVAYVLMTRSYVRRAEGNLDAAERASQEARELWVRIGASPVRMLIDFAEIHHARGETARAVEISHEVLTLLKIGYDAYVKAFALANLCGYLVALGRLDEAFAASRDLLQPRVAPNTMFEKQGVEHAALAIALHGDAPAAARLAGFVAASYSRCSFVRGFTGRTTWMRLDEELRARLSAQERAALSSEGASFSNEAAIATVLAHLDAVARTVVTAEPASRSAQMMQG